MSPIRNPSDYPDVWPEIRERVLARAAASDDFWPINGGGDDPPIPRCECEGQCESWHPFEADGRCLEQHGAKAGGFKGAVVLTVAHLDHDASAGDHSDGNLLALCQRCHLRLDAESNRIKATATRAVTKAAGTAPLFGGVS